MMRHLVPAMAALIAATPATAQSIYATAPADPRAITVAARGDGVADDSAAIQSAIDRAAVQDGGQGSGGLVFLPAGRYRITRTIVMWPGVRLYGVGRPRPVFVLAPATPGFQRGVGSMILFAGTAPPMPGAPPAPPVAVPPRTSVPFDPTLGDANSGTFYSAMANVDIEIGAGNEAATGIRFHAAQHAHLSHIDFRLGTALAGIYQVGNIGRALRFHGGRYGILTEKPSPAWQYTLLDSTFDGQRDAAIREHEAGLTLVNIVIRNVPVGIEIDRGYGDWLWGSDVRFEQVARAGIVISNEDNVYTQIGFERVQASATPVFAHFRDSGRTVAGPAARYRVDHFTHGLTLPAIGEPGSIATRVAAVPVASSPPRRADAIRALPPVAAWTNVRDLARGVTMRRTTPSRSSARSTGTGWSISRPGSTAAPASRQRADRAAPRSDPDRAGR